MQIAEIFASIVKLGSRNTISTSYFRPEVEIRLFRTCAIKNVQYNPYLWPSGGNFCSHCGLGCGADIMFHRMYF